MRPWGYGTAGFPVKTAMTFMKQIVTFALYPREVKILVRKE